MTKADELRTALKTAGYKRNQVSVAYPHGSLRVTVRDASIPLSAITPIANAFYNVRYCEASGEVLMGGNTYVDVEYARGLLDAEIERVAAELRTIGDAAPGAIARVEGVALIVRYRDHDGWWTVESFDDLETGRALFVRCDTGATLPDACMFEHAAKQLVENMIELRAKGRTAATTADDGDYGAAPVLSPSSCRPLAPFPGKVAPSQPAAVEIEDWAKGI